MLPLLGILAVLLMGLVSAGAAAGKFYNKRRWKKMKRHNKLKKGNRSPSYEIEEDFELGHEIESVEIDQPEKSVAAAADEETEMEEDVVAELMKVHKLSGPTRFLYTIEEETTEELSGLEDESKKLKKTRNCLMDLMSESDGKFMTPIGCPVIKSMTGIVFEDGNGLVNDMFDRSNLKTFRSAETTSFGKIQVAAAKG